MIEQLTPDVIVTATVEFNGKIGLGAIEIENVRLNWMLPTEFVVRKIPVAKMAPENPLTSCGILA